MSILLVVIQHFNSLRLEYDYTEYDAVTLLSQMLRRQPQPVVESMTEVF